MPATYSTKILPSPTKSHFSAGSDARDQRMYGRGHDATHEIAKQELTSALYKLPYS